MTKDPVKAKFITCIKVTDPDFGGEVEMEVWKDPTSGGLFAIDSSFLDQVEETFQSPFNPSVTLSLPEDEIKKVTKT
jgi:hypothetical protein